jgi:hypothetical protein
MFHKTVMRVYIIGTDQEPAFNTDDFISASWYSTSDLKSLIQLGEPTKGDLSILINLLHDSI